MAKPAGKKRNKYGGEALTLVPLYLFTLLFLVGPLVYMVVLSFLTQADTWGVVPELPWKTTRPLESRCTWRPFGNP